jgi:hypothetical protein
VTDDAQLAAAIREARPRILVNDAGGGHIPPLNLRAIAGDYGGRVIVLRT